MKVKVTAIISFLSGIGWGLFVLFVFAKENNIDGGEFLACFAFLVYTISTVLYVVWTKFGKNEYSALEKIDHENQLLKKQIEQKELRKKLEE